MAVIINNAQVHNMQIGPTITTKGLVSCWDVASVHSYPRTGNVWYDLGRNQNNGSLSYMSVSNFVEDSSGASFTLNGSDEYITVPDEDSLNMNASSFSIILWLKIPTGTLSASSTYLIGKRGLSGSGNAGWSISIQGTSDHWLLSSAGVSDGTNSSAITLSASSAFYDTWYMMSFTYDSTNKKMYYYQNELQQGYRNFSGITIGSISNTIPLEIFGTMYRGGTLYPELESITAGSISSLAIHRECLTFDDIMSTYLLTKDKHLNM